MNLRILAVSDLRVQDIRSLEAVADRVRPDLILYAGDDVHRFAKGPNSWAPLAQRTPLGLAGVIGNDCAMTHVGALKQSACHNLHEVPLLLDGLAVLGLQGAPRDEGVPIGSTLYTKRAARNHLERQLAEVGGRAVLLVSHCPPRGVLDEAMRFGFGCAGSTVVREFIRNRRVCSVVCGHVHLQGGKMEQVGHCTVVNVASHDHKSAQLRYSVLDWDGRQFEVTINSQKSHHLVAALPGVGPARAERLERGGFRCAKDLLDADDGALSQVCSSPDIARRLRASARAHETGKAVLIDCRYRFPEDATIVDVETSLRQNDPWLVGMKRLGSRVILQLQELDPNRLEAHLGGLASRFSRMGSRQLIQWGSFDRGALVRAHQAIGLTAPDWLSVTRWMDASRWVQQVVALPLPDAKLKTIARHLGYTYAADLDGKTVGLWYLRYKTRGVQFDVQRVRLYNRDDVRAVEFIVHAVQGLVASGEAIVEPPVQFPGGRRQVA